MWHHAYTELVRTGGPDPWLYAGLDFVVLAAVLAFGVPFLWYDQDRKRRRGESARARVE